LLDLLLLSDRFCWPCITKWSERETRCPFCKQRFSQICRKAIYLGDPHTERPSKRHKLNSAAAGADAAAVAGADAAPALAGTSEAAADQQQNSGSSSPSSPRGRLDGVVLETKRVAARDQVYMPEGDVAEFLQALHCMVCGADDNEEHLLICDGEQLRRVRMRWQKVTAKQPRSGAGMASACSS
jgi:hypothetical protein